MSIVKQGLDIDGTPIVRMGNEFLQVDVAPEVGGKVTGILGKASGHQFAWHNLDLALDRLEPYAEYDPNFYGGVDELLPNDIPERINGIDSPDHGELWTTELECRVNGESLELQGTLPLCGLTYRRRMALRADGPVMDLDYCIANPTGERRVFLWKLHAALNIAAGDTIDCPARMARVPDLEWSRWSSLEPFEWPTIQGQRADVIPPKADSVDFFYLHDLADGRVAWRSGSQDLTFVYSFDRRVFPYVWYFASYGGFDGHYMAILEPCTAMPISVEEAAALGQCSVLEPGETIETRVTIYAGPSQ